MKVVTTGHPTTRAVVGFNYFWEANYMLHIWWSCKNFRKQFMYTKSLVLAARSNVFERG